MKFVAVFDVCLIKNKRHAAFYLMAVAIQIRNFYFLSGNSDDDSDSACKIGW